MTKIHLSGLVKDYRPLILALVCKPVLLLNPSFPLFNIEAGQNNSCFCFSLPNWSKTIGLQEMSFPLMIWSLIQQVVYPSRRVQAISLFGQISPCSWVRFLLYQIWQLFFVWSFFFFFWRTILQGTLSPTRGLKPYPAVLQGQRNFKCLQICQELKHLS